MLKIFFIKKHILSNFTVYFQCFILFNTFSYIKLNFRLKINPKMYTVKNLEEIRKTWKKILKTSSNPV